MSFLLLFCIKFTAEGVVWWKHSQSSRSSRDISFLSFLLSFLTGFGGGLDSAALKGRGERTVAWVCEDFIVTDYRNVWFIRGWQEYQLRISVMPSLHIMIRVSGILDSLMKLLHSLWSSLARAAIWGSWKRRNQSYSGCTDTRNQNQEASR